ncbi:MAG: DUF4203 domain-containing protein [Oscillospiraceae bacterium]
MLGLLLYLVVSVAVGAVVCFFGKKLYFPVASFLLVLFTFSAAVSNFGFGWKTLLIALGISIIGCFLIRFFFKFGVFIVSALCGFTIGSLILTLLPVSFAQYHSIILIVCAIILGIIGIIWSNELLILGTAFSGAKMMVIPLTFLLFERNNLHSFTQPVWDLAAITRLDTFLNVDFFANHMLVVLTAAVVVTIISFIIQNNLPRWRKKPSYKPLR